MNVRPALFLLSILLVTGGCVPAASVRPAPVSVGQRYLIEVDAVGEVTAQSPALGPAPVPVVVGLRSQAIEEVLETRADGTIVRSRITYSDARNVRRLGARDSSGPDVLHGKTFVLTSRPGRGYAIHSELPLAPAEEQRLRFLHPEFGERDPIVEAVKGRELRVGQSYPELARALQADLERPQAGVEDPPKVKTLEAIFTGLRGDEAVFAVTVRHEPTGPDDAAAAIPSTGELSVHLKDATKAFTLQGPFTVDLPGVTTGLGTMKSLYRVRLLAAGERP